MSESDFSVEIKLDDLVNAARYNNRWYATMVDDTLFIPNSNISIIERGLIKQLRKKSERYLQITKLCENYFKDLKKTELFYLEQGNNVEVGYLVNFGAKNQDELRADSNNPNAKLISCEDALHCRDPMFRDNPGILLYPDPVQKPNYVARIKVDYADYFITDHAFERFRERIPETGQRNVTGINTQRVALRQFWRLFRSSVPVKRKNKVEQLINHNFKDVQYRYNTGSEFLFVVGDENAIVTCYPKCSISDAGYKFTDTKIR